MERLSGSAGKACECVMCIGSISVTDAERTHEKLKERKFSVLLYILKKKKKLPGQMKKKTSKQKNRQWQIPAFSSNSLNLQYRLESTHDKDDNPQKLVQFHFVSAAEKNNFRLICLVNACNKSRPTPQAAHFKQRTHCIQPVASPPDTRSPLAHLGGPHPR